MVHTDILQRDQILSRERIKLETCFVVQEAHNTQSDMGQLVKKQLLDFGGHGVAEAFTSSQDCVRPMKPTST